MAVSTTLNDFVVKVKDSTSLDEFYQSIDMVFDSVITDTKSMKKPYEITEYDGIIFASLGILTSAFLLLILALLYFKNK